jgi:hypothetical protein
MQTQMKMTPALLLTALSLLLCGCGSTLCIDRRNAGPKITADARPVYVTNPELKRENAILRASGIFMFAENSNRVRRLTLQPLKQYGACANPLMLSAITIGTIPGTVPGNYWFSYDLEKDGVMTTHNHPLPVYRRLSIWDRMVPTSRREEDVLAEALSLSKPTAPARQLLQTDN